MDLGKKVGGNNASISIFFPWPIVHQTDLSLCPLLSFLLLPAHDRRLSPVVTKAQSRSACEADGALGWGAEDWRDKKLGG